MKVWKRQEKKQRSLNIKKIPLTAEEEAYLKNYLEELPVVDEVDADSVFEALAAGDQRALQTLTSYYMKTAADMAVEMNIEEMQLADLIQEVNLCLIQRLELPVMNAEMRSGF